MAQMPTPPVPSGSFAAQSFAIVSTVAEANALKQGLRLVWLQKMLNPRYGAGAYRHPATYRLTWVANIASNLWFANPSKYPTADALNHAAWAQYQAALAKDNSGGLLNFIGTYVVPAVQGLVLFEVGGALYSGVTAGAAAPASSAIPTVSSEAASAGIPTVDASLPGLSQTELAATQAANIAASSGSAVVGAGAGGGGLLATVETGAVSAVGAKAAALVTQAISPKPAAAPAVTPVQPVQPANSLLPWLIGAGVLAAKFLIFT